MTMEYLRRRLDRVRAHIEHVEILEQRHAHDGMRAAKLARARKEAEIDAGRLLGLIAQVADDPLPEHETMTLAAVRGSWLDCGADGP